MEDIFALDDAYVEVVARPRDGQSPTTPDQDDTNDYEVSHDAINSRPARPTQTSGTEPEFQFDYQPPRARHRSPTAEPFNLGLDQEIVVKHRAPQAKLDDARLLGPSGIPKIRDHVRKKIKFRGKGHELQDLSSLLENYQFWAHELFPKAKFRDAVKMIRKVGKTKVMKMHRRGIITDFLPKPVVDEESDQDDEMQDDAATEAVQPHIVKPVTAEEGYLDDDDNEFELSDFEDEAVHSDSGIRPVQGLQGIINDIPHEEPVQEVDDVDDMDALEAMGVTI